jgi:hypothetical protein
MRYFLALLLAGTGLTAGAATISDTIENRSGVKVATNISFFAVQRPLFGTNSVRPGWTITTNSAADGTFTVTLLPGDYNVTIGLDTKDKFLISVPDAAGPYRLGDLSTNVVQFVQNFPPTNWILRPATALAAGKYGFAPTPSAGQHTNFLRGDGTWAVVTNTGGSGGSSNIVDVGYVASVSNLTVLNELVAEKGVHFTLPDLWITNSGDGLQVGLADAVNDGWYWLAGLDLIIFGKSGVASEPWQFTNISVNGSITATGSTNYFGGAVGMSNLTVNGAMAVDTMTVPTLVATNLYTSVTNSVLAANAAGKLIATNVTGGSSYWPTGTLQGASANLTNWSGWATNTVSGFYTNAALGAALNATNTASIARTNLDNVFTGSNAFSGTITVGTVISTNSYVAVTNTVLAADAAGKLIATNVTGTVAKPQLLCGASSSSFSGSSTPFYRNLNIITGTGTDSNVWSFVTTQLTLTNLYVRIVDSAYTALAVGTNITMTLMTNGVATPLAVTVTGNGTTRFGTNTANAGVIPAMSAPSWKFVGTSATGPSIVVYFTCEMY